ncbi:hypothetical protein ACS212_23560, partial [Escherichia coli]
RDGRWQDAVAIGEQELRRAYLYGFAKGEIDEIKANILSALSNAAAQKDGQRNGAIAEGLISNSLENAVPTSPDFDL